jgi:hypothetical protein
MKSTVQNSQDLHAAPDLGAPTGEAKRRQCEASSRRGLGASKQLNCLPSHKQTNEQKIDKK